MFEAEAEVVIAEELPKRVLKMVAVIPRMVKLRASSYLITDQFTFLRKLSLKSIKLLGSFRGEGNTPVPKDPQNQIYLLCPPHDQMNRLMKYHIFSKMCTRYKFWCEYNF